MEKTQSTALSALNALIKKRKCRNCSAVQAISAATLDACRDILASSSSLHTARAKLEEMKRARGKSMDSTAMIEAQAISTVLAIIAEAERRHR